MTTVCVCLRVLARSLVLLSSSCLGFAVLRCAMPRVVVYQLENSVRVVRSVQDSRLLARRESLARDLTCPITGEILIDPVVAADGHTYERQAIERWLQDHQTSPLTNAALTSKQLLPNLRLKAIAEEARRERDSRDKKNAKNKHNRNLLIADANGNGAKPTAAAVGSS